ncbi:hypothetical protein P4597_07435 [Peribacillus simplex]|uniref:hypothetical protein n=1 Tax=Peribacillus simplex TaxID=1478 RepID=UPI002E1DBA1D|nr:hypothetical protein [Peribacillus simplex]
MKFKVRAQFLRENMEKHIDYLTKEIHRTEQKGFNEQHILDNEERELLLKWATENDSVDKYYDLLIQQFVHSSNFDSAIIVNSILLIFPFVYMILGTVIFGV